MPNRHRWQIAVEALLHLARCRRPARLVVAYPLAAVDARRLRASCARRVVLVVNLATPLPMVLRGRGARVLSAGERSRVREMFSEGYHRRRFAGITLANALPPVARTARVIARRAMRGAFPSPARRS